MGKSVIITAGGVGKRMGAIIPKQFLLLQGKPVLMHTMQRFVDFDSTIEMILVLPKDQLEYWKLLCETYQFDLKHLIAIGGAERFDSVKNGLVLATGSVIAVHDAVRPLVSIEVITACYHVAHEKGAAIPVVGLKDSIRKVSENDSSAVDRSQFKLVQTPQCFNAKALRKAYQKPYSHLFTDDASVVEESGYGITLVQGNDENIKLTTPMDLKIAEILMTNA